MADPPLHTPRPPAPPPPRVGLWYAPPGIGPRAALSLRAIALGFALTLMVSTVTVFSDNVLHNTYLVGNHFPILLIATITVLCMVVNPLLGPRRLHPGEMAVALAMMTLACAMPSSGFWRYFPALLNDTVLFSAGKPWYQEYLAYLPDALLPSKDPNNPLVGDFFHGRDPLRSPSWWAGVQLWLPVYATWCLFLIPMFAATLLLAALFRKQWVVHERLTFPFATIPLEMLAEPRPGRRLNDLWRSWVLWVGAAIPFVIHLINGYAWLGPGTRIVFPLRYDLNNALQQYPWNTLHYLVKANQVYFLIVGVMFFVPLEISFSLWFFFIINVVAAVYLNEAGISVTPEHQTYQGLGMFVVYGLLLLWIARHHLRHVAQSLFKPREPDEFLPYGLNVALLLACILLATGFVAQVSGSLLSPMNLALGFLLVALILFYGLVLTRLVIDAGVLMIQVPLNAEVAKCLGFIFTGHTKLLSIRQWMTAALTSQILLTDQREALMPFAADSLRLAAPAAPRERPRMLVLLAAALLLSFVVSGVMHHVLTFKYGRENFDDGHGPRRFPALTMDLAQENIDLEVAKPKINRPLHVGVGAALMAAVGTLRLLFAWFPLHPIGLLMWNNWAIQKLWFSIFLCWAAKALILRFGGANLYNRARYFFMGLIVGEALAGVFWNLLGLLFYLQGSPWASPDQAYQVLPH